MASTVTLNAGSPFVTGDRRQSIGTVNLGTYATNGIAVTAAQFGFHVLEDLIIEEAGGLTYAFDKDNMKVKAYRTGSFTPNGSIAITPHSDSAGTPAGTIVVTPHADSAGTPAGTNAETSAGTPAGTNAASVVTPGLHGEMTGVVKGTPALTHNADPVTNLSANPLYVVEAYGVGNKNIGVLQSNCNGTTSIVGSVDDASGVCGAATPRFFVTHNATPAGVPIYVNEADSDKLCANFASETDCVVMMPFEAIADGVPGFAYAVTIHHDASAATYSALYFDDDGAADAQLAFVDAGGAGGVIYADDIEVVAPQYMGITGNCGSAAAQTFTGAAMATHGHAFTGSAMSDHSHASTAAFTGSALGTHSHASTAAFTGTLVPQAAEGEITTATDISAAGYTARFIAFGR